MQVSETLDERGFFQRLRRVQLQLLMRTIGLSYKPSTPATSLSRILADSGEMSEADAILILEEDFKKKNAAAMVSDKAERLAELAKNKAKNLAAAKARQAPVEQETSLSMKSPASAALESSATTRHEHPTSKYTGSVVNKVEDMNFLQLKAYTREHNIVTDAKTKVDLLTAIKEAENGEDIITGG